jgi:hypothetical protein
MEQSMKFPWCIQYTVLSVAVVTNCARKNIKLWEVNDLLTGKNQGKNATREKLELRILKLSTRLVLMKKEQGIQSSTK